MLVMNKSRFSAEALLNTKKFTLSVANETHKEILVRIGKVSGRVVPKFNRISELRLGDGWHGDEHSTSDAKTAQGGRPTSGEGCSVKEERNSFAALNLESSDEEEGGTKNGDDGGEESCAYPACIEGSIAHLYCRVLHVHDGADAGHHLVVAQVAHCRVSKQYFDGKVFAPRVFEGEPAPPPYLTFLGSQTFGCVTPDPTKVDLKKIRDGDGAEIE